MPLNKLSLVIDFYLMYFALKLFYIFLTFFLLLLIPDTPLLFDDFLCLGVLMILNPYIVLVIYDFWDFFFNEPVYSTISLLFYDGP